MQSKRHSLITNEGIETNLEDAIKRSRDDKKWLREDCRNKQLEFRLAYKRKATPQKMS